MPTTSTHLFYAKFAQYALIVVILFTPSSSATIVIQTPPDSVACDPIPLAWTGDAPGPYTVNVFGFLNNATCDCSTATGVYSLQTSSNLLKLVVGSDQDFTSWYWLADSGTDVAQSGPFTVVIGSKTCAGELDAGSSQSRPRCMTIITD